MSPELNGNPPTATRRKKNRSDKKTVPSAMLNDYPMPLPTYNCFQNNLHSYPNLQMPDTSSYYPFFNYSMPTEPMSLPVYPSTAYHSYSFPSNPNLNLPYGTSILPNKRGAPSPSAEPNEYMSLPIVSVEQNDASKRRFSDPGPNDSDSSLNSTEDQIIQKLSQQIHSLKECNRKLNREVMDMRMELNLLKQQQTTRYFDRDYEPGMLADIIREVRDAARVREDALIARVKHMIEEKQLSLNQFHLVSEKNRNNDRLTKLEEQIKNLNINHSRSEDNVSLPSSSAIEDGVNSARQVIELEREALLLRRELQDARAKKEESDQKLHQLDKKLSHLLRRKDTTPSETSEDGKTSTISGTDTFSTSSGLTSTPQRVTLSGPVTDL